MKGEHFLTLCGYAALYTGIAGSVDESVDEGRRWILRKKEEYCCAKCGGAWDDCLEIVPAEDCIYLCKQCINARPTAPAGHEYTGEWRVPELGEAYLSLSGDCANVASGAINTGIDGGRRWILKKVEDVKPDGCWNCWRHGVRHVFCPGEDDEVITHCDKWAASVFDQFAALTRRVEELEKHHK